MDNFKADSAIERFHAYIVKKGIWDEEKEKALVSSCRKKVLKSFTQAEKELLPSILSLFDDVLDDIPKILKDQQREMEQHIAKYPEDYPLAGRVPHENM